MIGKQAEEVILAFLTAIWRFESSEAWRRFDL